jgi:hypothetical protein
MCQILQNFVLKIWSGVNQSSGWIEGYNWLDLKTAILLFQWALPRVKHTKRPNSTFKEIFTKGNKNWLVPKSSLPVISAVFNYSSLARSQNICGGCGVTPPRIGQLPYPKPLSKQKWHSSRISRQWMASSDQATACKRLLKILFSKVIF